MVIEGVKVVNLITNSDERGFFREVFRFPEQFPNFMVGQLSHSLVQEGVVKGWHGHVYQSQWNYILEGSARVALKDDRKTSQTFGEIQTFEAGEQHPIGYFFPTGILHAYRCSKGPMHIIYVTSGTYDMDDEIRIEDKQIEKNFDL